MQFKRGRLLESGQDQFFQVSHTKRCKHAKYEIKFRPLEPQILKSIHGRNRQTLSQAHPAKTDVLSWSDAFLA